jgi:hypothetical protein
MPYNPTLPANSSALSSAEMRSQLTGLQANIIAATADKVTQAQLASEISGTAINPAGVQPLAQSADGSYNQSQFQQVMDKLDELLNAIKRP